MSDIPPTDIQNESVWEFPMRYPLKVLGEASHPMATIVAELLQRHIKDFDASSLTCRLSAGGKYISVSAEFTLLSKEQVNRLYADLAACPQIKLVL